MSTFVNHSKIVNGRYSFCWGHCWLLFGRLSESSSALEQRFLTGAQDPLTLQPHLQHLWYLEQTLIPTTFNLTVKSQLFSNPRASTQQVLKMGLCQRLPARSPRPPGVTLYLVTTFTFNATYPREHTKCFYFLQYSF